MNPVDIIQTLWNFGHFFSPEALAVDLVAQTDLPALKLDDPVVKAAVRSYQQFFHDDLDRLTLRAVAFGGFDRPAIVDGEVGPNTEEVLTLPRCGMPDYRHPLAQQEGNWPDQCRNEITTSYRMTLSGLTAEQLAALWVEGDSRWNDALELQIVHRPGDYPNTRIYSDARSLSGSILAWQTLAVSNCGARLEGTFNSRTTWSSALACTTITHEHGHGLGFNHVNDSQATMYPSITSASMSRRGKPNESDMAEARKVGYKARTTPIPPPIPPTPPGPVPPGIHQLVIQSAAPIKIIDKPDWFS